MNTILNDRASTHFQIYSYAEIVAHTRNPLSSESSYMIHWWPSQATGELMIGGSIGSDGIWRDYTYRSLSSFNTVVGDYLMAFSSTNITDIIGTIVRGPYTMFTGCYSLKTVNLPYLSQVGWGAFTNVSTLQYVSLPNLRRVERNTFYSCRLLQNIYLPKCSFIGSNAFQSCAVMSWASLPECTYIDSQAFVNAYSLKWVYIGGDCSYIGNDAFYGCNSLSELILDCPSLPTLGSTAVFWLTPLASGSGYIYVRSSLVDIYKSASRWSSLSSVITPL